MGNSNRKEGYNYIRNQPKNVGQFVLSQDEAMPRGDSPWVPNSLARYPTRGNVERYEPSFPQGTYFAPARPPTQAEERKWTGVL